MTNSIEVTGLTKRYGDIIAVGDLSISVPEGSVFAFLGTNGAGKSTTIACLTTVERPDGGRLLVGGHDVVTRGDAARRAIGVVFQDSLLDASLTVRENLTMRAQPYLTTRADITRRIDQLATALQLNEIVGRRYGKLSGGQRRRVDIARAIIHEPKVLFLDEPTTGLDPAARQMMWSTIRQLRDQHGLTIFLTTHYMEETEEADQVAIIDHGALIAQGTPAQLRAEHSSSILTLTTNTGTAQIPVENAIHARQILIDRGGSVLDFEFRHGRMDDVFVALTGRTAEAMS